MKREFKEYRKVSELKEWARNPRTITPEGLERLKEQITRLPQYKPMIITKDGTVLGGNMRLRAYKALGTAEVWVSTVNATTKELEIEYAMSDNDRVARYELDEVVLLAKEFPKINWKNYAVDVQVAPLVIEVKEISFKDTLFDRADINSLTPNKYNYRQHPEDQIEHLIKSIQQNGIYRNILIAKDKTILDGHAVVEAAKRLGFKVVPVRQLDITPDSIQALKIVVSNNELSRFAEADDRKLTDALKVIKEKGDAGLLGTGFNDQMFANLLMVTRPMSEIHNFDVAAEWIGMPKWEQQGDRIQVTVNFTSVKDKLAFLKLMKEKESEKTKYIWYPHKDKMDLASVKFE